MTREASGRCMCGAVSFRATDVPDQYGVCHCVMCRKWTGSALVGVSIPKGSVTWQGAEHIAEITSSGWARRGWCAKCGTGLYFQFTAEGTYADETEIPLGVFDDPNGFTLRSEIYIDDKPDSFAYAGDGHRRLTRAEVQERLPILKSDDWIGAKGRKSG